MPGSMTSRKIMSKWFFEILNRASSPDAANSGTMPYGESLFCRKVRISGLSSTASTRNTCSSWRGVGTDDGITGAGGAETTGAAGTGAAGGGIGASAKRGCFAAADGNDAASGDTVGTTRRLVRGPDVPTTADNAAGDSGVTPLASRLAVAVIFSEAVFS